LIENALESSYESSVKTPVYSEGELQIRQNFDDIFKEDQIRDKENNSRPRSREYLANIINEV
jgi:hypothetical protein